MEYAIFLRGVNVGGIKVPMADLRQCLTKLPVDNVKTYLQSGNVTLTSDLSVEQLKTILEKTLTEQFSYTAYVLIFPREELASIVKAWPYGNPPDKHRYAIFCDSQATIKELITYANGISPSIERIAPGNNVVYWQAPKGASSDTTFSKIISKLKYKPITTSRNLNTLEKMI